MRVLICGSRDYNNWSKMEDEICKLPQDSIIVEGEARGADSMARTIAKEQGLEVLKFPANWRAYGRAAGPIRNKQMLVEGRPNLVLAFYSDIEKSKGTANMVSQAKRAGIPVREFEG